MRIDYALTFPAQKTPAETREALEKLRHFCMDRPFELVSPISRQLRPAKSKVFDIDPILRIGFFCLVPGGTLDLALYRFPRFKKTIIPWAHESFVTIDSEHQGWTARHAAIISVLEQAGRIGFGVDVEDPCGFQKHHSRERLVKLRRIIEV